MADGFILVITQDRDFLFIPVNDEGENNDTN